MAPALKWLAALTIVLVVAMSSANGIARADEMRLYVKSGAAYDDVKMDLETAIEHKGLRIGAIGDLGDMLARTRADVTTGPLVYKSAHYMQFCSAALAHKLAAADPKNLGHCPFLMFIYEAVSKPGEVVVGYRPLVRAGSVETRAVLDEIDGLFESIAREAIQ